MKILFSLIVTLSAGLVPAFGQNDTINEPFRASIRLTGKSYGDRIVLRWAPTTPGAWAYLNKTGYIIERLSFTGEEDLDPARYVRLNRVPLLPRPLAGWEEIINNSENKSLPAIAAQALYGKSFSSSGATLYDQADEFMNRFSFSLLAADLSAETAEALGLRYEDREVENDKHYMYRVFPAVPSANYKIDTAYLVLQNVAAAPVPAPVIEKVYESENQIVITWDKRTHETIFSAYYIERSDDGGLTYRSLTELPYINPSSGSVINRAGVFQYADSVPENYKPYHYRLIGITAFGETSPPSPAVKAMGRDRTPPAPPQKVSAEMIGDGTVLVTWEKPEREPDLAGYYIGRGDNLRTNFKPIHDQIIPPDSTAFIDYKADRLSGNYYVVAAVDTAGNGSISMVSYAALVDSIPPAPPTGLTGHIDSTGVVTIQWRLGQEPDLAGYMVYFANRPDHVFTSVNRAPLADTVFTDTIPVKTLTRKIYYKIKAVDTRWNYSEYSATLELTRPDLIPPTRPVFSDYAITEEGIRLEWIPSSSEDVAGYDLQIRVDGKEGREVFIPKRSQGTKYVYTDREVEDGKEYRYTLQTVDEAGLRSEPSHPVTITTPVKRPGGAITDLRLSVNSGEPAFALRWTPPAGTTIKRYVLYRAAEGTHFVAYKSIPADSNSFTDTAIRKGINYEYTMKIIFANGRQSPFSNIVSGIIE